MTNKILGIDFGRKKIGLAWAESFLAEPLKVIRYDKTDTLVKSLLNIIKEMDIQKIVIGISEGQIRKETLLFAKNLKQQINIPIVFQDETLTTKEAQRLSFEAGIKRKKRKDMEDAYSASIILQDYLDRN